MTTTTKQTAMSVAEFLDCDLHSGAALARIRAALEQRERLLEACKAVLDNHAVDPDGVFVETSEAYEKLRAAIAAAEGR